MKSLLLYLIQSGCCLAVFYLAYELFLKRETFFQLNRIYLVSGLWLSFLIPGLPITSPLRTVIVPVSGEFTQVSAVPGSAFGPAEALFLLYGAGVLFFLLRFVLQLRKLRRVVRTHGVRRLHGVKIVAVERLFSPFSFFDIIFLNPGASLDANLRRILAHEQVHIRQLHTLDALLMEIVLSLQWFNPFVWSYKKAIQETHEYLADSGVIAQGFSSVRYQLHMFEQNVGASLFEFGHHFKKSQIKRRIIMLSQIKSPRAAKLKLLLAVPMAALLVLAFAEPRLVAGTAGVQEKQATIEQKKAQEAETKDEIQKLQVVEQDLRAKLETASDDASKNELKKKLEVVLKRRQALQSGASSPYSSAERDAMAKEIQKKEMALKAEYEKTTDEARRTELKADLREIQLKKESLMAAYAKAGVTVKASESSMDEMKKMAAELKAKAADVREKLAATNDPEDKAELEGILKKIQMRQTEIQAQYAKAVEAGKADKEIR